MVVKVISIINR